jgi:hypothetical protein
MMQVPGAFAASMGRQLLPPSGGHALDGRTPGRDWGPLGPASVGATTRDEQWTVCRDMICGGSKGPRAHFTRATCPCSPPYRAAGCRVRNRPALVPIEHGRFGAVPGSHLGGIGLELMLAFLAPHDQPHAGRGGSPERHRRRGRVSRRIIRARPQRSTRRGDNLKRHSVSAYRGSRTAEYAPRFARYIGMDAFTPCLLNLIRGETPMFADHYVGSGIGNDPPVPHLHELSFVPQAPVGSCPRTSRGSCREFAHGPYERCRCLRVPPALRSARRC